MRRHLRLLRRRPRGVVRRGPAGGQPRPVPLVVADGRVGPADPAPLLQALAMLGGPTGGVPSVRAFAVRSLEGCDPERVRESEKTMMFFELLSFRFDDFFLPRPLTRLETFS